MADLLRQVRKINGIGDTAIAEPFAGGAGAALSLLFLEETPEIFINDVDISIYDFWWSVVHRPKLFVEMLAKTPVSIAEWGRQRAIYRRRGRVSRLARGFSTFYLNRCNRSGIIMNGGPIGGIEQAGKWKLSARYNKKELQCRCERVAQFRERVHVSCRDGIEFIASQDIASTFFFIDPPYFNKGPMLYMNGLDEKYHLNLALQLKTQTRSPWMLTYDDCPQIRKIYCSWATIRPFSLRYSAAKQQTGKEILIVPRWMRLPSSQSSAFISW